MKNESFSLADIENSISIENGIFRKEKLSLFAVVRNEILLIGALLNHYRDLGIEQFLVLDDGSDDGTNEFLFAQADCVVLSSPFSVGGFGYINICQGNTVKKCMPDAVLKRAIGQKYFLGRYAVHADADEFLVLPAAVSSFVELINILDRRNIDCVVASMVDFYPTDLGGLFHAPELKSLADLLQHYQYYDAKPVLELVKGQHPRQVDDGTSARLFRKYGISNNSGRFPKLSLALGRKRSLSYRKSVRFKTPILKWSETAYLRNAHEASIPPTELALLAMMHFRFTHGFEKKFETSIVRKTHGRKSTRPIGYRRMVREMNRTGGGFMGPDSRKFENPDEFLQHGIAKWELDLGKTL